MPEAAKVAVEADRKRAEPYDGKKTANGKNLYGALQLESVTRRPTQVHVNQYSVCI